MLEHGVNHLSFFLDVDVVEKLRCLLCLLHLPESVLFILLLDDWLVLNSFRFGEWDFHFVDGLLRHERLDGLSCDRSVHVSFVFCLLLEFVLRGQHV